MTRTIRLIHSYDAPARAVWGVCTDFDALAQVCAPLVRFEGLPAGRVQAGQVAEVGVRLFGRLPPQPYRMEVVAFDEAAMTFESHETGAGVRMWRHRLAVQAHGPRGARLIENIEIDAGVLTPLYALWARKLYSHRHAGRLALLARFAPPEVPHGDRSPSHR